MSFNNWNNVIIMFRDPWNIGFYVLLNNLRIFYFISGSHLHPGREGKTGWPEDSRRFYFWFWKGMLSSFTLCYSFNSKNLAFPVIWVFSKWPLLVYCYITKKARIIIYTTFPTFLGSRNPMKLLFWKSESNFRFYVELKPKISFVQLSQLWVTLSEKK